MEEAPYRRRKVSLPEKGEGLKRIVERCAGLDVHPDPLYWGADEYEVLVDAERGVLLRCASRLAGEDFDALEVEEIHFDERFPEDTFASREPLPWR